MPRRDGTGPWGDGQRTGGGLGYCSTEDINVTYPYFGRGYRKYYPDRCAGGGLGRGFRNRYFTYSAPLFKANSDSNEKQFLEAELKHLQLKIDSIKNKLDTLREKGMQL